MDGETATRYDIWGHTVAVEGALPDWTPYRFEFRFSDRPGAEPVLSGAACWLMGEPVADHERGQAAWIAAGRPGLRRPERAREPSRLSDGEVAAILPARHKRWRLIAQERADHPGEPWAVTAARLGMGVDAAQSCLTRARRLAGRLAAAQAGDD